LLGHAALAIRGPNGEFYYDGGWNHKALIAMAVSGALSIGLSLAGAYGLMFNVGDWGWLIGASVGAIVYTAHSKQGSAVVAIATAGE
jgi:NCS1 family nucleobase:cation symporter-1